MQAADTLLKAFLQGQTDGELEDDIELVALSLVTNLPAGSQKLKQIQDETKQNEIL